MEVGKMMFIINPRAGNWLNPKRRNELLNQIRRFFGRGVEIVFSEAEGENSISNLAKEAQKNGRTTIVVRGGDGSLNQAVNGLDISDPSIMVGVIPAGTGNDVASTLGIPWEIKEALRVIAGRHVKQIDLGIANGVRFANTISIGLDASVNQIATALKPWFQRLGLSFLAYIAAIGPIMCRKRNDPEVSFETDSESFKRKIAFAAVTNCHRYGRGFLVNPKAKVDDGWLNLCILNSVPSLTFPYYALRAKKGTHVSLTGQFSFHRFKQLKIEVPFPVISQIDGEVHGPLIQRQVSILPRALNIIVPQSQI